MGKATAIRSAPARHGIEPHHVILALLIVGGGARGLLCVGPWAAGSWLLVSLIIALAKVLA